MNGWQMVIAAYLLLDIGATMAMYGREVEYTLGVVLLVIATHAFLIYAVTQT